MRLTDIDTEEGREAFLAAGVEIPGFDREELKSRTKEAPAWIHFGAGNIFRAFPAAVLQKLLMEGSFDKGVIVCEGFDWEIIEKAYKPFDNLSLLVVLKADGTVEKKIIGSVTESLCLGNGDEIEAERVKEIFESSSLQMASFTITEKGYAVKAADGRLLPVVEKDLAENGLKPAHLMGKLAVLLYDRYLAGAAPIAMVSMDNCSHNGDKLKEGVLTYAKGLVEKGLAEQGFLDYVENPAKVSFPWSMIDKITPRPDEGVRSMLLQEGFEEAELIITSKNTYTSAFVNAEETEYLVIEDAFPNGRPPLEKGGIIFTDRETVDKVEKMKVCTCLNPLHTAMAIYGCLLGYTSICKEMEDADIVGLITRMGYEEGMPVVVNPGIISPEDFIAQVLKKRLPNPFMPDTPQRIASDTSQKLPIRFGETLKAYLTKGEDVNKLIFIPLVLAGYLRYLLGVDDTGKSFEPSPDPLLVELRLAVSGLQPGALPDRESVVAAVTPILSRKDIFLVDLHACGLEEKIIDMFLELCAGEGAVRRTLHKYVAK
ncbi:MAG: mannitol dehydrogenase family protein [Lachnospiraceae bacterium]